MPTSWTEATVDDTTWQSGVYPAGTEFVLINGVVLPVDANGDSVTPQAVTDWTEATATSTTFTEATVASTTFTETTL